jgi:hypothetical protein
VTILASSSKFTRSELTRSSHTSNVTSSELRIIHLPLLLHLSSIFFPLAQSIPTSDPKYFYSYPSQFSKVNKRVPSSKKISMAPRKKLDDDFDASATPSPLKPKTEKAKVEKVKSEKAKVAKPKKEKVDGEKPKAVKKVEVKKEKEKGDAGKKDGGKDKVKPVTGEEAQELILKYLKEQNRPYGATDVSANLHGKVCSLLLFPLYLASGLVSRSIDGG